jgi:hypothetical protein
MSFSEREAEGGSPVECYVFGSGRFTWYYTSAETEIELPAWPVPFTPAPIIREPIEHSPEDASSSMRLTVPRTFPPIAGFTSYAPPSRIPVILAQAHRDDEDNAITPFRGRILAVTFEDSLAKVECCSIIHELGRRIPLLGYHRHCNLPLFGSVCGVAASSYQQAITVTAINGTEIQAEGLSIHPSGWFNAGWVEWGEERRFIVSHVTNTVTLMNSFAGLSVDAVLMAYAGCDHTEAACMDKFSNLVNHLGFARVPWRNPHKYQVA